MIKVHFIANCIKFRYIKYYEIIFNGVATHMPLCYYL